MTRFLALLLTASLPLASQWLHHPDPSTPRTKDGKPNLSAPAPRVNGKPDLSGLWQAARTSPAEYAAALGPEMAAVEIDLYDVTKYTVNAFWDVKPGQEPMRPEATAIMQRRAESKPTLCLPNSPPIASQILTFKIIPTPREILILHETGDPTRQIYMDGRSLPKDPEPTWMGYSVGKWQGDTLIVETTGITDRAALDFMGHPRSDSMRITERYRRRDFGHMDLEIAFDDPKLYTRPFGYKLDLALLPDSDVLEYICNENEKSRDRIGK